MGQSGVMGRFSAKRNSARIRSSLLSLQEHIPELWTHFQEQGVESHMFASQWFLTLYTAKFPLFMVFLYLDIFLLLGMDSVFQVALALLQVTLLFVTRSRVPPLLQAAHIEVTKSHWEE